MWLLADLRSPPVNLFKYVPAACSYEGFAQQLGARVARYPAAYLPPPKSEAAYLQLDSMISNLQPVMQ